MIRHAEQMVGATDPDEALALWNNRRARAAAVRGEVPPPSVVAHRLEGSLTAYVNHSRWVADCPDCNAGIAVPLDGQACVCLECGAVRKVELPDARTRAKAEKVLLARAKPQHRNWRPDREPVERLTAETELLEGVVP